MLILFTLAMCTYTRWKFLLGANLLAATLWAVAHYNKKRRERFNIRQRVIKTVLVKLDNIALETCILFWTLDRLVTKFGNQLEGLVDIGELVRDLNCLADKSKDLLNKARLILDLLRKEDCAYKMGDLAQSYEREIEAIRPHILKIRQDLKVAEALAQVSLLTSPAARRRLAVRSLQLGKDPEQGPTEEYQPPKDILLYLVRMGSFNSAPKILNDDHQDRSLNVPASMSRLEFMDFCARERCNSFQLLRRPFLLRDATLAEHIRRMSLSALGQTNDSFVLCPEAALTWDFRKFHLIEEIIQNNADVICLQEVDHFEFLQKLLATQGYEGVFYPKPDSPCVYIEGNNGPDGCAIFYKKDKFECIAKDSKILEVWKVQSNQVAILVVLRSLQTQREVCVVTTHLKAKKGALLSRLRNEQGKDLLEFIGAKAGQRPVVICGDFNAEPSEPVYKTVLSDTTLGLGSAYANFLTPGSEVMEPEESAEHEVPYTTWKVREEGEVCHTIDYIFYSQQQLKVNGILGVPSPEDMGEGKVPSYHYPSDHFSLVCDFSFKPSHEPDS